METPESGSSPDERSPELNQGGGGSPGDDPTTVGETGHGGAGPEPPTRRIVITASDGGGDPDPLTGAVRAISNEIRSTREQGSTVDLGRSRRKGSPEVLTWHVIQKSTESLSFKNYMAFMDYVLCNDREAANRLDPAERAKIFEMIGEPDGDEIRLPGSKTLEFNDLRTRRFLPYTDSEAYLLLKIATEAFVTVNCGIDFSADNGLMNDEELGLLLDRLDAEDSDGRGVDTWWDQYLVGVNGSQSRVLPYLLLIRDKLKDIRIKRNIFALQQPFSDDVERCYGILANKLLHPCMLELIWSYWLEEGMMVQTVNAISRRFQNVRAPSDQDPLAMVEMDPLRPLNNLIWGYVQDEQHRLSVVRRSYEYDHHYGLSLEGKAVPPMRTADSRSRFLEAFHQVLHQAMLFYRQDDDTTMVANGFALMNALRDLHMVLSEGAHNQFGDLPTTARIEMLMEQWLLARPEFRELLPRRTMVAYPETWMDSVDAMKRLQGWSDTSINHFRFLAMYGEQILLSVRFTRWSELDDSELAAIWARFFRNQVQGYVYAYRAVTGVDLSAQVTTTQQRDQITMLPSVLIRQRLQNGQKTRALPSGAAATNAPRFRERRAARESTTGDR
jgi:hypothetical protein